MNEREFVSKKREAWDQLTALLDKTAGPRGLRALNREEVLALGPLYRRVSSDLAYARTHAISEDLALHLNGLVGRTHALLYEAETSGNALRSVANFYLYEFPAVLQKHLRYFLAAFALTVIGGLFAYWVVMTQPERMDLFVPKGFEESVKKWTEGEMKQDPLVEGASWYMTHNFQVGMVAFASGVFAGLPTISALFDNGAIMGALAALMQKAHRSPNDLWPGVLPHGIAELSAIFICGAAGLLIGMSWLFPGRLTRGDSFRQAGTDAVKLVLGTIPLFIFAGIIESMFSRLAGVSAGWRYAFSAVNGVMWYLYFFLPRSQSRRVDGTTRQTVA